MPTARALSLIGNQLLTALFAVDEKGPSPTPNIKRTINKEVKLKAVAVKPQKIDQTTIDVPKTFLGPKTSEKYPPMKLNNAYPMKKLLRISPISAGSR